MKKLWLIGWKDVLLAVRDPAALVFMLAAPFLLTLGLGLVTGRLSGPGSGPSGIPVTVVNLDEGQLGQAMVDMFTSDDLSDLVSTTESNDPRSARETVEQDQATAAVIVPEGFTGSIIPQAGNGTALDAVQVELYMNPTRPTSSAIVKTIVDAFMSRVEFGTVSAQVWMQVKSPLLEGRLGVDKQRRSFFHPSPSVQFQEQDLLLSSMSWGIWHLAWQ